MARFGWRLVRLGAGLAIVAAGCGRFPRADAPLTIATTWPAAERSRLAEAFARWAPSRLPPGGDPVRIAWVEVGSGTDLLRLARRLDMVLGVPAAGVAELERAGRLVVGGNSGQPAWRVARRLPIGWASNPQRADDAGAPVAFDDPRRAPLVLAWARGVLAQRDWSDGYASLVEAAARADYAFPQPGSALAAVERGEAAAAPLCVAESPPGTGEPLLPSPLVGEGQGGEAPPVVHNVAGGQPAPGSPSPTLPHKGGGRSLRFGSNSGRWVEAVAIVRGGENPTLAELFLRFLNTEGMAEAPQPADQPTPVTDGLLADLLGATLVDAQNELISAWRASERAGRPAEEGHWLTEPPPWPPASVDKLLKTDGAGPLLATLTEQITPDAETRAWLRRSWLLPARRVDGALLDEFASAVDGRLARELRFRAWLRAEWTAWARQRYRRVERQLGQSQVLAAPTAFVGPR